MGCEEMWLIGGLVGRKEVMICCEFDLLFISCICYGYVVKILYFI